METLPFLEDIYPQNLLYAVTIRSNTAKGLLKSITASSIPEGYTLITAKDIPGTNKLEDTGMPILAETQLSYIGEPIALLVGADKTLLKELASKCVITAEEEKPVFVCNDGNIEVKREIVFGDTTAAFEKSERIVKHSYTTGIQDHWYAEPAGAVCWFSEQSKTAKLTVRTATQWPHHVKRAIVNSLKIETSAVSIEPTALNLHMDGKLWYPSLIAVHAALGALKTKKPVRLILTREEDFLYTPKRCSTSINITSSVDEKGGINAAEVDISVNLGAFGVNKNEILDQICYGALNFYQFKNIKLSARANCTNIPPQGPFSGFGLANGLFAMERHLSIASNDVKQDPARLRLSNLKGSGSEKELIETAAKLSDYYRKWASLELLQQSRIEGMPLKGDKPRGIGIALGCQSSDLMYYHADKGTYTVEVTLTKDSILEIKANIATSEDYNKIWEKVALETMSIKPEMVHIVPTQALDCGPSCSSRNITAITKLVKKCCLAIRKQRFHDPLPITVRRSVKPQNGSLMDGQFAPQPGTAMNISGFLKPGIAAAVVEVSIDLVECIPVIRGIWLAVDGGKIISKNRAKRSLMRGITQALGWAFTENIEYINGAIPRTQYENFTIYSSAENPPVHIEFINSTDEPKGIGDLPCACIPAAFLQAVSQAAGHSFKSIPLKRNDIWELLRVNK
ncbi:MAG: molybdopterin-dependent oxidoreductase [Treponema sp.]|nr:molybdopterin-dependent oxidoreductase [Treponema sp.]